MRWFSKAAADEAAGLAQGLAGLGLQWQDAGVLAPPGFPGDWRCTWRERLARGLLLLAQAVIGFDRREDFERVRAATLKSEREPPPRLRGGRYPLPVQQHVALVGKTDGNHNKGATGPVSIWHGERADALSDTGVNETAWNRFANVGGGKWVVLLACAHGYEIIAAEC